MILNNSKDVLMGLDPVSRVLLAKNVVWERSKPTDSSNSILPYSRGIVAEFTPEKSGEDLGIWKNTIDGGPDVIFEDAALEVKTTDRNRTRLCIKSKGVIKLEEYPKTIYLIVRCPYSRYDSHILAKRVTSGCTSNSYMRLLSDHREHRLLLQTESSHGNKNVEFNWHLIDEDYCLVTIKQEEADEYGIAKTDIRLNNSPHYTAGLDIDTAYYGGEFYLGDLINGDIFIGFAAFSTQIHTEEEIRANAQFLMEKYIIQGNYIYCNTMHSASAPDFVSASIDVRRPGIAIAFVSGVNGKKEADLFSIKEADDGWTLLTAATGLGEAKSHKTFYKKIGSEDVGKLTITPIVSGGTGNLIYATGILFMIYDVENVEGTAIGEADLPASIYSPEGKKSLIVTAEHLIGHRLWEMDSDKYERMYATFNPCWYKDSTEELTSTLSRVIYLDTSNDQCVMSQIYLW